MTYIHCTIVTCIKCTLVTFNIYSVYASDRLQLLTCVIKFKVYFIETNYGNLPEQVVVKMIVWRTWELTVWRSRAPVQRRESHSCCSGPIIRVAHQFRRGCAKSRLSTGSSGTSLKAVSSLSHWQPQRPIGRASCD